ncbi:hypothetical protein [Mycobacterium sp. NPDC050853]|uniref:hypothetical protein n=1 Tax=Mycobacteriaceae TaxID=1762 RepID=UPI0015DFA79C|nr:hypothetical protein [Mycobacteroides sp. LB1]
MGWNGPAGEPEDQKRPFLDRLSLNNLWRVAVVAVLGLTAGFGGLDKADPKTPVALNDVYDNGPLQITPHSVFAICQTSNLDPMIMKALKYELKTYQMIALSATVKNTDKINVNLDDERKSSSPTYREIFTLTTPTEFKYYGDYIPDSGFGKLFSLPPGKTVDLLAVWGIPFARPGMRTGDKIGFRMNDLEWKPNSAGSEAWSIPKTDPSYGDVHTALRECDS